ncbi:class I SAM-dependent methyltransferase [Saccharothrix luteola]|uniref:class I SAM-dependent methyltransferase n=1 Tax=Saccharothrix luteola TaxID=2893018 RepID=UPI001E5EECD0|nr:class I SAM-dependent methyltransferase [Saccharothrix luteola]MCC8243138.1 class I SAM-dependent methyltransferase [Saccharothrix luteola]
MTAHFDILARRYRRYAEITDLLYRPWLTGVVGDGARALDLGCGSGRYSGLLADRYAEVLAVDGAAREIALAEADNARPNITYQARDLFDVTPDRDGRFDLVLAVNTLFAVRDYGRVLPHVRSLIAPGGRLVVIDVVNPPGRRPSWHRAQAFRVAAMMAVRHRSPAVALDVLRLRLHPTWLEHVTRNTPPTRDDCHAHYRQAFPGARLDDTLDRYLCGVVWNAPA